MTKAAVVRTPLPGVRLRHELRGHSGLVRRVAFSPDGVRLATASEDGLVRVWDLDGGRELHALSVDGSELLSVAWSPDSALLAAGSVQESIRAWRLEDEPDLTVEIGPQRQGSFGRHGIFSLSWSPDGARLAASYIGRAIVWDLESGEPVATLTGHRSHYFVCSVAYSPGGDRLVTAGNDESVRIWDGKSGEMVHLLEGHKRFVRSAAWSPDGRRVASASSDRTIKIWDAGSGQLTNDLEGHSSPAIAVQFTPTGEGLVSHGEDRKIRLWSTVSWLEVGAFDEAGPPGKGTRFFNLDLQHPSNLLATCGDAGAAVHVWELDLERLLGVKSRKASRRSAARYRNAKVVLIGDTGVGKSGLALVLTGKDFRATDSTDGRHVWTLEETRIAAEDGLEETREILLWDLAGQPGYRLVHQMHLGEVAVAMVVFDARSETDPLAGIHHWDRALRQAQQRDRNLAVPLRKFLVVGRADRGGVALSPGRIDGLVAELGYDACFHTSAKQGWKIAELGRAIRKAVDWRALPQVSSTKLFERIKKHVLAEKAEGRLLTTANDLFRSFEKTHRGDEDDLRGKFDTCLSRLENRDLIRRLSFGSYILMQPELLDVYASAIVNAAKTEPEGLGSIAEEAALAGKFAMAKESRISQRDLEELVLIATVKELVDYDLALLESADEGKFLVFPSQFVRDWPDAPDPEGREVVVAFEGPIQNLYATLCVRLAHSGLFATERSEMWRNAAIFRARAGGRCGLYLRTFEEGRGELTLFYSEQPSPQTRFEFEEYVLAHLERRAIRETVQVTRLFVCPECGTPVPREYAEGRLKRNKRTIECGVCGHSVPLRALAEKPGVAYESIVDEMNERADRSRRRVSAQMTLKGKIEAGDFDVFMCHNRSDQKAVHEIGRLLKERGILPWVDEWELQPGKPWQTALEKQIRKIGAAAVFLGPRGRGPWQNLELMAFLSEFNRRGCPVIPVILPRRVGKPRLPPFLKLMHAVDFRVDEPDPLEQLIFGITGERVTGP